MIKLLWLGASLPQKIIAVGAIILALWGAWEFQQFQQRQLGAEQERTKQLRETLKAIDERNKINAEIEKLDDAGLCHRLGGVFTDGKCREGRGL